MSTNRILLSDATCNHAPSSEVLSVSLVGDVVFLAVSSYEESHDSETISTKAEIAVDAASLVAAIELLRASEERHQDPERQRVFAGGCSCE